MINDKRQVQPAVYLIIDKNNKVVAYTAVNVKAPIIIREEEDPELFNAMRREGCAAVADPTVNYVTGLGVSPEKSMTLEGQDAEKVT